MLARLHELHGGILGCKFAFKVEEEAFGNDITTCIRDYKNALASKKYDFFVGPTNSACMLNLGAVINAGGKPLISGIAADHQPFFELFKPLNFHASVSTFLEGRSSAVAAKRFGWKKVSLMVPNYAYGQDAGKAFQRLLQADRAGRADPDPAGASLRREGLLEVHQRDAGGKPDGLFTAFFGPFIVPFWKQWKATGNDRHEDHLRPRHPGDVHSDEKRRRHPGQHLLLQPSAVPAARQDDRPANPCRRCTSPSTASSTRS